LFNPYPPRSTSTTTLATAKKLACRQGLPAGASTQAVAGFRPFAARDGRVVSNEQLDQLRDAPGVGPAVGFS
jgi:hypothetical protein